MSGRKVVYIAGPISAGDLAHNIDQATAAFRELAGAGLAPICPHWSCFSGGARVAPTSGQVYALASAAGCGLSHADWLAIDLELVARADAVLRLPGASAGADLETGHALALGVPVFDAAGDVIRWARESETCVAS